MISPEERAAWYRLLAAGHRKRAAEYDLSAACVRTGEAFRRFAEVVQGGYDSDLAQHPDLAEVNVRLDALYDLP